MERTRAIRARGIGKQFGDVVALDGVDLDVPTGQIHGVVGPNGAGKTALLGLLLGLAVPDRGELEILGTPVRRALDVAGVAGFVDGPGLYPSLTARQNLTALANLRGYGDRPRVADALDQVGLADVADDRVGGFSLGMRQRVGLAAALLTVPRLLVPTRWLSKPSVEPCPGRAAREQPGRNWRLGVRQADVLADHSGVQHRRSDDCAATAVT